MGVDRPFRFGVQAYSAVTAAEWKETARRTEALGYSALHLADHYVSKVFGMAGSQAQELAAVPAMAVVAAVTQTLRIGCRVFCIDYHHPAVLLKEAATLDLLSDGRLELGVGAGWVQTEYEAMGLVFDRAGVRIDRLGEVIALIKEYFSGNQVRLEGKYVRVAGFQGVPPSSHRPPILIGGGARRVLTMAGREADIVSLNFNNRAGVVGPDGVGSSTAAATDEKITWIREGAGSRFNEIELEIAAYFTAITGKVNETASGLAGNFGLSTEEMLEHPNALIGTVDDVCDRLVGRRERYGISYVTVPSRQMEAFAPVVQRLSGR